MSVIKQQLEALERVRFADLADAPSILRMVNESMSKTFRVYTISDIVYLIDYCVFSICLLDACDDVVGFLAAKDYPQIPSVHPSAWEEYLWTKYKAIDLNSRDTIFMHMLCWEPAYARDAVDKMLKSLFMHDPYLQHICMMKPLVEFPLLVPGQSRAEASFRRVQAMEKGIPGDRLPCLCVADRQEVCPRLRIRRAVEEDNDDIVPILERQTARLQELYGEFYISELISCHPESERVLLVCEYKEVAVGVMCLNTQVNFDELEAAFELSPFGGLRHISCKPMLKQPGSTESTAVDSEAVSYVNIFDTDKFTNYHGKTNQSSWSGITDENVAKLDRVFEESSLPRLDYLNLLEDDEDFEFDIVNIDNKLLRVSEWLYGVYPTVKRVHDNVSVSEDRNCHHKQRKLTDFPSIGGLFDAPPGKPLRYSGTPNAFVLELFAIDQNFDERYGFDMLEVAFELFPDLNYCVLCLPSNHAPFPLLEHFTYVTPYGFHTKFVNESLYVAHVNSVRGRISVRPGEPCDMAGVADILEHASRRNTLLKAFRDSIHPASAMDSFVLLSENTPVGVVILEPLEHGVAMRTKYDLNPEPLRAGTDGNVLAGVVSPVFEAHSRWFIRELLRYTKYTNLFWKSRLVARGDANPCRYLMSLGGHMAPVRPRSITVTVGHDKALEELFADQSPPYALWYVDRPLTGYPTAHINNSIVVIGASRTGLAFIEGLLLGPSSKYLMFNNVTLVSEHGLSISTECLRAADICLPQAGRYTDKYIKSIPYYFYVDVISAVMVKIDRKQKCIHLRGGGIKYYDTLVLTCGVQYQHPDYLKEPLEQAGDVRKGKPCERLLMDDPAYLPDRVLHPSDLPLNVFLTNSIYQANVNLKRLMHMIADNKDTKRCLSTKNRVVVYGECLEVYTCISALMELGLTSDQLAFVEPFPAEDETALRVNCFNDEQVDERVQMELKRLGIVSYRHTRLVGWRLAKCGKAMSARFVSRLHAFQLPTFALFYYGKKAIDINSFKAINECGLVYDGGVVVGPEFETNDPNIFAAGSCTKYSRRLYADKLGHPNYSSEKVAEALSKSFLKRLDPFIVGNPYYNAETSIKFSASTLGIRPASSVNFNGGKSKEVKHVKMDRRWEPVPKYNHYLMVTAYLPGCLQYMKLRSPGPDIPMEVQLSLPHQGHTLETDKNGDLFRLRLDEFHVVVGVTCLCRRRFPPEIITQLYGRHESFFHNLLVRFKMGLIDDLYSFFEQPQHAILYQETFGDLINDIHMQDVGTVYDLAKSHFNLPNESTSGKSLANFTSLANIPNFALSPRDAKTLGTFRSVIESFMKKKSVRTLNSEGLDIPTECGQSDAERSEARDFWNAVGGERIAIAYITRYLHTNAVTCTHYAQPTPK